jgi:hypothetical protein
MQPSVYQSFISTTCFGHTGPSSGALDFYIFVFFIYRRKVRVLKILQTVKIKNLKIFDCRIGILRMDKAEISKMDLCYKNNKHQANE